jgi:hypothetical protein
VLSAQYIPDVELSCDGIYRIVAGLWLGLEVSVIRYAKTVHRLAYSYALCLVEITNAIVYDLKSDRSLPLLDRETFELFSWLAGFMTEIDFYSHTQVPRIQS